MNPAARIMSPVNAKILFFISLNKFFCFLWKFGIPFEDPSGFILCMLVFFPYVVVERPDAYDHYYPDDDKWYYISILFSVSVDVYGYGFAVAEKGEECSVGDDEEAGDSYEISWYNKLFMWYFFSPPVYFIFWI